MASLGRYQLGSTIELAFDTGADPTAPPVMVVAAAGPTTVQTKEIALARPRAAGSFYHPLFLGNGFATGDYTISITYTVGVTPGSISHTFTIIPGGSVEGSIHSIYFFRLPQADLVIQSTEAGNMIKGKNPSI